MADKAISELIAAEQIKAADLFVLEQDSAAKKLTGQILLNWLTAAADGHGGIHLLHHILIHTAHLLPQPALIQRPHLLQQDNGLLGQAAVDR